MAIAHKIKPFLWYDNNAEEAATFYVSLFKNSRVVMASPMIVEFEIEGQPFTALNGGPMYKFTEAFSVFVTCESQEEVDTLWSKLTSNGGAPSQCGWLKDKYGLSWQIIPKAFMDMMSSGKPAKSKAVMEALLKMSKIDIATLQTAYDAA